MIFLILLYNLHYPELIFKNPLESFHNLPVIFGSTLPKLVKSNSDALILLTLISLTLISFTLILSDLKSKDSFPNILFLFVFIKLLLLISVCTKFIILLSFENAIDELLLSIIDEISGADHSCYIPGWPLIYPPARPFACSRR